MRALAVLLAVACHPSTDEGVGDTDDVFVLPADAPLPLDPAIEARVDDLLSRMSLDDKLAQLAGSSLLPRDDGYPTPGVAALGIPGFHMSDGPRGCTAGVSTAFPVAIARAASWDPELEQRVGEAIGLECAAHGVDVLLAPAINLVTHPAYGRAQENYGEDPWLTGRMAVGFVNGAQRHVLASAKHFAANNIEDTRFDVDVTLDPRTLREVMLPHFRAVVREAGVASVMAAYNQVNGAYCAENRPLLTGVLRDDWGFQGFVESDWAQAVHDAEASIDAGLDLEMPVAQVYDDLGALVGAGVVDVAAIDAAVRRLVRRQLEYGLDDRTPPSADVIASAEHVALAREAAAAGLVLLKNDGDVVPLAGGVTVAVVGALAVGESTGDDTGSSHVVAPYVVTPLQGLTAALGADHVVAAATDTPSDEQLTAIGTADVAVVVVGLTSADEGEHIPGRPGGGDREQLDLHAAHEALIAAVAGASDHVVVVLVGGSAITVEGWVDDVEGVVQLWYAGLEGGNALADVLTGAVAPSGRMPLTVPTGPEQLPPFDHTSLAVTYPYLHGYRHVDRAGLTPRFPFGYGLSTTTFALSDLRTDADGTEPIVVRPGGALAVHVGVENRGTRRGAEVVQVYVGPDDPALGLPDRVLAAFSKVWLDPGGFEEVVLQVPYAQLATWDEARHAWVVRPGTWHSWAGTSSRDLPITWPFEVAIDEAATP